jgi:anaerobic selenocysteine-containing dehydrogenase
MRHYLAPSGITPEQLRSAPGGIRFPLETTHRKYQRNGFATPSGRLEIFSEALQSIGQPALPEFDVPVQTCDSDERFPLLLTSAKTPLFCHSQHRNLPRLRRTLPNPIVEMSPATAASRGIDDGDWVAIVTSKGRVRARARLVASLADGVVGAQHGWWQACPELGLPGYDALSDDGANVNLVIGVEISDPVSGAAPHRSYPCEIERYVDRSTARAGAALGHSTLMSARSYSAS